MLTVKMLIYGNFPITFDMVTTVGGEKIRTLWRFASGECEKTQ